MTAHRMQYGLTALVGVLTLAGGLLLAAPSAALAPPGGVEQFQFSNAEDYPRGGLAAGSDGNVWFTGSASSGKGVIGLIDEAGKFTEYTIPTNTPATTELPEHSYPYSIAQGPGGDMWFIDSGTTSENRELIGRVIMKTGEIKEFPAPPAVYLGDIAPGPDGNMWFTANSGSGGELGRITPAGVVKMYLLPTQASSSTEPAYSNPVGIAEGQGGYMWFSEQGTNDEERPFIGRINTSTEKIEEFPVKTKNSGPTAITQGPGGGTMWFVESNVGQVGEIAPTGEVNEFPVPSTTYSQTGIAAGPDGNLWFIESFEANSIGRISPSGSEVKSFPLPTKGSFPQAIVRGPDDNMWFVESGATEVGLTRVNSATSACSPHPSCRRTWRLRRPRSPARPPRARC